MCILSILLLLFTSIVSAEGNDNNYNQIMLASDVLIKEFGINWYNILNAEITCCPYNYDQESCEREGGANCIWFRNPHNPIAQAGESQCLGQSYVRCKRKLGIDQICNPKQLFICPPGSICPPGAVTCVPGTICSEASLSAEQSCGPKQTLPPLESEHEDETKQNLYIHFLTVYDENGKIILDSYVAFIIIAVFVGLCLGIMYLCRETKKEIHSNSEYGSCGLDEMLGMDGIEFPKYQSV